MPTLDDITGGRIKIGNTTYNMVEMKLNGQVIWPTTEPVAELIPSWTFGGNYTITTIPAGGGYANVTWTRVVTLRGVEIDRRTVTTSTGVSIQSLSDATNFSFSNSKWTANNRGTNGYSSSTSQPTSAQTNSPARTCTLTANYSGTITYNGRTYNLAATSVTDMTQNANIATHGNGTFTTPSLSVSKYTTSSSPAAAGGATDAQMTSVSGSCQYLYTWTSGSSATWTEQLNNFSYYTLSVETGCDWLTLQGSGNRTIKVWTRDTTEGPLRSAQVYAAYTAAPATKVGVSIYQQANSSQVTGYTTPTYSNFAVACSSSSLAYSATYFDVTGSATETKTEIKTWTSGAQSTGQTITSAYTVPGSGLNITATSSPTTTITQTSYAGYKRLSFSANNTDEARTFTVKAYWTDPNSTRHPSSGTLSSTVSQAARYAYTIPVVTIQYATIGAAAHSNVYPTITFTQSKMDGATVVSSITGTLTGGSKTGTASDGTSFTLSSIAGTGRNGTFNSSNMAVSIGSRGTTESSTTRVVADNILASITCHGMTGTPSNTVSAIQAANPATPVSAVYSSVTISSFKSGSTTITRIPDCKATTVTPVVVATWTDAGIKYAAYDDGDATAYTGLTQHNNQSVTPTKIELDGIEYSGTSASASNLHSLSEATHSFRAYWNIWSATKTIKQDADSQTANLTKNYVVNSISLSGTSGIWAGGGSASIAAIAKHTVYSKWNSDDTVVSGSETDSYDTAVLSLSSLSSQGAFTIDGVSYNPSTHETTATLNHRDMTTNATTDSTKVTATNGSDSKTTAIAATATNTLGSTIYTSYGSWHTGTNYPGNYRMVSFSLNDYHTSSSRASFKGARVGYSASAAHSIYRDDTRDVYQDRYYDSNWGSLHGGTDHNDAQHRTRTTIADGDSRTVTVTQTVTGDAVSFTIPSSDSWLSVDTANSEVVIAAQPANGSARMGRVTASNANGGAGIEEHVYQYGYASISVIPLQLDFNQDGGVQTLSLSWKNTEWAITYPYVSPTQNPTISIYPPSGGSLTSNGTTTISITCQSIGMSSGRLIGQITITPTAPGCDSSDKLLVTVTQEPGIE